MIVFDFLKQLQGNNNREWFNAHKEEYEAAKNQAQNLFNRIETELQKIDIFGKAKMYRIYRDTRFSTDKTPYKNHFGFNFMRKQPQNRGSFYVHIEPQNVFIAAGFWGPEKDDLLKIRRAFDFEDDILQIIENPIFKNTFGNLEGEELKTAPKGFDKNHPRIDLIRKKQFLVRKQYTDSEFIGEDFPLLVAEDYIKLLPFLRYMTSILTTDENGESLF